MENGWKIDGLEHKIENEGGDGVVTPRLVDERIVYPNSDSKFTLEVQLGFSLAWLGLSLAGL